MALLLGIPLSLLSNYVTAMPVHILPNDFPDPSVTQQPDGYYAFGTSVGTTNVQIATSSDFNNWQLLHTDALPGPFNHTDWILNQPNPSVWAPDVIKRVGNPFTYMLIHSIPY